MYISETLQTLKRALPDLYALLGIRIINNFKCNLRYKFLDGKLVIATEYLYTPTCIYAPELTR